MDHFLTCEWCLLRAGTPDSGASGRLAGLNFKEACRGRKRKSAVRSQRIKQDEAVETAWHMICGVQSFCLGYFRGSIA
ncbi:hypothetical protein ONE63_010946 [Megalurothrips usitatus]|uniref:Uncharacterized protein n=1 Tax=Megalurothrips usitatus TaxID=439358 RepID=A0AAV7XIC8_9NEOP|nr:hypothetical protein ONE63_010946 [Megalurothrips usitatus]